MEIILANDEAEKSQVSGAIFQKLCASCNSPAKYSCPKCSTLSCSLNCVKSHKINKSCDGVREVATFVPVEEFHEKHLFSDYHFLEDVGRKVDNAHRAKRNHGLLHFKPINLQRLQSVAMLRKTKLEILPISFSKRKVSTTFLRYRDNKIFWRVEWMFPMCDVTCSDERIDEEELLGACLDKYLIPSQSEVSEKLEYYQGFGHKNLAVLLKDDNAPCNEIRYHVLRQNKSLKVNFKHKRIIEFPTLIIVPKFHLSAYTLVERKCNKINDLEETEPKCSELVSHCDVSESKEDAV